MAKVSNQLDTTSTREEDAVKQVKQLERGPATSLADRPQPARSSLPEERAPRHRYHLPVVATYFLRSIKPATEPFVLEVRAS